MACWQVLVLLFLVHFTNCLRYDVGTFTQVVDHFNWNINAKFEQRYFYTDEYYNDGPIIVYTGNEGPIEAFWNSAGFAFEIAKELSGYVIFIEHRYYGKSLPFGDKSFDLDKVGFLSVEQAVADYAVILTDLKKKLGGDRRVIALGGSYGGMLSAYIRFKYPNVVDAALASSAPVYLAANIGNNHSFWELITKSFHDINPDCPGRVRDAFIELQDLRDSGAAGLKEISSKFSLCKPLESADQVDHLIGWIRNAFAMLCMCDYPYAATFLAELPAHPVKVAANLIMNTHDALEGLVHATALFYNGTNGTLTCFDPFTEYVECSDPTGCGLGNSNLAWDYQVCTELNLADGTNNITDMFAPLPWTMDMKIDYCMKRWAVTPRPGWFATSMWGMAISSASNIVFPNGALDPWRDGGVPKSMSDTQVTILIEGGAHHLDLRASNPLDPPTVVAARKLELDLLQSWISSGQGNRI